MALKLDPEFADAYLDKARSEYTSGKKVESISDFSNAIKFAEDNKTLHDALCDRAITLAEMKRYKEALADADKAVELKFNEADAYHTRSSVHQMMNNYKSAIADISKAIELNPDDAYLYASRGGIYFKMEEYDNAIKDWMNAKKLNPQMSDEMNKNIRIAEDKK